MTPVLPLFLVALLLSSVLTPLLRDLAIRCGKLDHAVSSRKIHGTPIPRMGGMAMVAAFFASFGLFLLVTPDVWSVFQASARQGLGLLGGGAAIAALGIVDDMKGTRARAKFLVQFGVAAAMYLAGFRIDAIALPLGPDIVLGWFGLPFTMLWIAGVINAVNLIDGLDGLAGGTALAVALLFGAVAALNHEPLMLLVLAALAGAVVGFLLFNFNPASIFMGDTGSMFLGLVLALAAIPVSHGPRPGTIALLVPVIALGLPIADTLLAIGRRAARGAPLFAADRGHIHHRLLDLGLSHRHTVLILYGISMVLCAAAFVMEFANAEQAALCLFTLLVAAWIGLRKLGFMDLSSAERVLEVRRRNMETRSAIRRIGTALRFARTRADVWAAVQEAADTLGAEARALELEDAAEDECYREGFDDADAGLFRTRHFLGDHLCGTYIEFGWKDGPERLDRDTEIAIEMLCDQVGAAVDRVEVMERERSDGIVSITRVVGLGR